MTDQPIGEPHFIELGPAHYACLDCDAEYFGCPGGLVFCPECHGLGFQYGFIEYIEEGDTGGE